ncbi:MAG TPA: TMEM165/GDT1 family protein [Acidimicrobiales bacterium]|nr:TMEM165/GDT1 family protein [Acidimicrobiales bacterium]
MHLSIVASVFPIIFFGELPDKTMFASLVLATKGRPSAVWLGATVAFAIHVAIAVSAGIVLFHLLSPRTVDAVVSAMFIIGAALALREARNEERHEEQEEELAFKEARTHRQTFVTAFIVIFLAEWGDLTQVLTANLAARYHSPLSVGLGAMLALVSVAGIAVIGGRSLMRWMNPRVIRIVTALVLLALGIVSAVFAAR